MEDDDDDSDEYEEVDMFANVGKINEDNPSARYAVSGLFFEIWMIFTLICSPLLFMQF